MRDEPYRWIEAIRDRRDYIEDQLSQGSPVVGLSYDDGMLLLTVGRGQRKIFEVAQSNCDVGNGARCRYCTGSGS